jgi:hypothetical protein
MTRSSIGRRATVVSILTSALMMTGAHAVTVTRGPYLQVPTTGSMTLRWRTDTPTDSRVKYGAAPGSLTVNVDDSTVTTEHEVLVSGLAADTQYYYSIGSVLGAFVGDDADHFFRTNPPVGPARPIRIFSPGDGGYLNHPTQLAFSAHAMAVRDAYAAFTSGTPTDLFIPLGDNAYTISTDVEMQRAIFDGFHDLLRATPILPVYGNHEQFSSNTLAQTGPFFDAFTMPTAAQAGGVASGSETYFSIDYANVHIIFLDTERARPADSGAMMAWLAADLAAADADWTIAMWHRPPYSKGLFHDSDGVAEPELTWVRQNILPVLDAYGVDAVFNGHSHNYERSYFIDGHYGLSNTFTDAFKLDAGDGDPAGDGAYRKASLGATPNSGAVYVVSGSSSEVRNSTLNHPAHLVNLLQYGAFVIDINGNTLTGTFLDEFGAVLDTFQIVKGDLCSQAPASGCATAPKGKFVVTEKPDPTKSKWSWKWKGGTLTSGDVGNPGTEADVAVCVYQNGGSGGPIAGGYLLHGAPEWTLKTSGYDYKDPTASRFSLQKVKVRFGAGNAQVQAKAKGPSNPGAPLTFPILAQFVNLDTGACWESTFTTAKKNTTDKVVTVLP